MSAQRPEMVDGGADMADLRPAVVALGEEVVADGVTKAARVSIQTAVRRKPPWLRGTPEVSKQFPRSRLPHHQLKTGPDANADAADQRRWPRIFLLLYLRQSALIRGISDFIQIATWRMPPARREPLYICLSNDPISGRRKLLPCFLNL